MVGYRLIFTSCFPFQYTRLASPICFASLWFVIIPFTFKASKHMVSSPLIFFLKAIFFVPESQKLKNCRFYGIFYKKVRLFRAYFILQNKHRII